MISIDSVVKQYSPSVRIGEISLDIPAGGITALVGPNGAGKSTLLTMIGRLLGIDEGTIEVGGLNVATTKSSELARPLSILRQENHFISRLTVRQLVGFGRFPHSKGRLSAEDEAIIDRYIGFLDLEELEGRYLDQLSGGQRQRVALAMTLAASPSLLIADEPTTALDVTVQRTVLDLLDAVTRERGVSLLFISHDLPVVARMADRVIVVDAGRITDDVPVEVIRTAPDMLSDSARSIASAARALDSVFERIGAVRPDSQPGHAPGEAGECEGEPASSTDNEGNAHE